MKTWKQMKTTARKLLIVIPFVISSLLVAQCSATRGTTLLTEQTESWTVLSEGCVPGSDEETFLCTRLCLETAYDDMVNCEFDKRECQKRLDHCELKCTLELEKCNIEKNEWHRKWYITGAIGTGVGCLVTLVLILALGGV